MLQLEVLFNISRRWSLKCFLELLSMDLRELLSSPFANYRIHHCYSGYQSHAPFNDFFPISKTKFWWTSIKCIHDKNRVHFVSVSRRCSIVVGSGTVAQLL